MSNVLLGEIPTTLPCSLGGRRFSEGTSADREIQRTLMEVKLNMC